MSSVRVDSNPSHDFVTVFIRGANCGTLCMGKGDGGRFFALLEPWLPKPEPPSVVVDAETPELRRSIERALLGSLADGREGLPKPGGHVEPTVTWRGSVDDLVTDLRAAVPEEKLRDLRLALFALPLPIAKPGRDDDAIPKPSRVPAIAEASAANELKRRGLDLAAMNLGRNARGMWPLTAVEALDRINEAAGPIMPAGFFEPELRDPVGEARELLKAAFKGALPISVSEGMRAWLQRYPDTRAPSLGVMPEHLWREKRAKALSEAITAREGTRFTPHPDWVAELEQHQQWLREFRESHPVGRPGPGLEVER